VADVEQNQGRAGDANGEADNIDERRNFVAAKIAQSDFEIVFEHAFSD
jgi:hypothetical protein